MEVLDAIYTRRSVRQFNGRQVEKGLVHEVLKAGTWAPSGMNNQPWRFVLVRDPRVLGGLSMLTRYGKVIGQAPVCIAVFADRDAMYDEVKDSQAVGACIQNMLLAAHGLGLGAVWLGEILKNSEKVRSLLMAPENLRLMAVVALGYPVEKKRASSRLPVEEVLIREL